MAGWNTPARNAAINKRLGDQRARRSIFPVSRSRHPDARSGSGVDDFSCPLWWQRFPKACAAVAAMNASPTRKVGPALVVSAEDPRFEGKETRRNNCYNFFGRGWTV